MPPKCLFTELELALYRVNLPAFYSKEEQKLNLEYYLKLKTEEEQKKHAA